MATGEQAVFMSLQRISMLLSGGDDAATIPRRAVLCPGSGAIRDKKKHPELPEIRSLSLLCAYIKEALQVPIQPLDASELFEKCLENPLDATAWTALIEDIQLDVFDWDRVMPTLQHPNTFRILIDACITGACNMEQSLRLLIFFAKVSMDDVLDVGAFQQFSDALALRIPVFLKKYASVSSGLIAISRDHLMGLVGEIVAANCTDSMMLRQLFETLVASCPEDAFRIFMRIPLLSSPDELLSLELFESILTAATTIPPTRRYPVLLIITHCVETLAPRLSKPIVGQALHFAMATVQECMARGGAVDMSIIASAAKIVEILGNTSRMPEWINVSLMCKALLLVCHEK
jgi:hypothetical protein